MGRATAPAPRRRPVPTAAGLFLALLALHLAPIWLVRWVPTQEGPLHVENMLALMDWPRPEPFRTIAASIGRMEHALPCVDLRSASRVGDVEYVLVSGTTRENLDRPCGGALASELASRYEPVYLSQPTGLLEIWRPRVQVAGR